MPGQFILSKAISREQFNNLNMEDKEMESDQEARVKDVVVGIDSILNREEEKSMGNIKEADAEKVVVLDNVNDDVVEQSDSGNKAGLSGIFSKESALGMFFRIFKFRVLVVAKEKIYLSIKIRRNRNEECGNRGF